MKLRGLMPLLQRPAALPNRIVPFTGLLATSVVLAIALVSGLLVLPPGAQARSGDAFSLQTAAAKTKQRKTKSRRTRARKQKRRVTRQQGSEAATDGKSSETAKPRSYAELFKQYQIDERSVGYIAVDAATGAVVAARRPDGGFIPASSIKAPTAIMALNVLGANYKLSTRLFANGSVRGGVLRGDLILVGGGNPELFTDDFASLVAALKARGITRVSGRFLYDNSMFPDTKAVSDAHDNDVSYNAGVGALSLNFNRLRLKWIKSRKGLSVSVYSRTDKLALPVDIVGAAVAPPGTRTRRGVAWDDDRVTPRWLLSPRVRRSGEMWVPVKRAGLHAAHVFQQYAKTAGITLPNPRPGVRPDGASVVANHLSDPLVQVARRFLKYSNNVATEIVGQTTTRLITGKPLTIEQSGAAMAAWYRQQLPKVNWTGLRIANHSGLSRDTSISPRQMVSILRWARTQNYAGYRMWDIVRPYWVGAGTAYTQRRFRRTKSGKRVRIRQRSRKRFAARRMPRGSSLAGPGFDKWIVVRGKTGTINHARSLVGYMVTKSKRELIFAVFIDDDRAQLAAAKAGQRYKRMSQGRWAWRSRAVLRGVLRKWLLEF